MAIARDTQSEGNSGGTSITFAHTCNGTERLLLVYVADQDSTADNVTGVTYDGVAMTKIVSLRAANLYNRGFSMWGLVAPSTGTNNIVVTRTNSANNVNALGMSYTGVSQIMPTIFDTSDEDGVIALTCNVTIANDGSWAVMGATSPSGVPSAGTNATYLIKDPDYSGGENAYAVDNSGYGVISAGAFSLQVNSASSGKMAGVMVAFSPPVIAVGKSFSQII